jgi:hypothetical protein
MTRISPSFSRTEKSNGNAVGQGIFFDQGRLSTLPCIDRLSLSASFVLNQKPNPRGRMSTITFNISLVLLQLFLRHDSISVLDSYCSAAACRTREKTP